MKRILIIDDEKQICEMLSMMLKKEGYEVITSFSGKKGIEYYREKAFDLVITDIIMPDIEGLEIIRRFIQEFPEIKIIAMSGGGHLAPELYLKMAGLLGAVYSFQKPISQAELINKIKTILD